MEMMDFHSLPRRELQVLCKKHKIPANMTNVAMADALAELYTAGAPAEDCSAAQESKKTTKTSCVSSGDELLVTRSRPVRSSRRGSAKAEKEIDGIPLIELQDTPVVTTGRKTRAREAAKTPAVEVAVIVQKKQEEVAASNSRRSSMRPRKMVSFAVDEDGGFGIEVKKTPVAPRIDAKEEIETARQTTRSSSRKSASARATGGRRSARLKAVPKMVDLSAAEEHSEAEAVISKKLENLVSEQETSDSVVTYEADGEEEIPSSARRGSVKISEDVTSPVAVNGATAGAVVTGQVEEPEALQPAVAGGDVAISEPNSVRTQAPADVREVSPEVTEKEKAEEPSEDTVDESTVGPMAIDHVVEAICDIAGDGEEFIVTVPEIPDADHVDEAKVPEVADSGDVHCDVGDGEIEVRDVQEDVLDVLEAEPLANEKDTPVAEVEACCYHAEDGEVSTENGEELEKLPQVPDLGVAGVNNTVMEADTVAQVATNCINSNDNGEVFEQEQDDQLEVNEVIAVPVADDGDEEHIAVKVVASDDAGEDTEAMEFGQVIASDFIEPADSGEVMGDAGDGEQSMEVGEVLEDLMKVVEVEPCAKENDTMSVEVLPYAEDNKDPTEIGQILEDLPQILDFLSIAETTTTVMKPIERKEADIGAQTATAGNNAGDFYDLAQIVEKQEDMPEVIKTGTVPTADDGDAAQTVAGEEKELMLIIEAHKDVLEIVDASSHAEDAVTVMDAADRVAAAGYDGAMDFSKVNEDLAMKAENFAAAVNVLDEPVTDGSYNSGAAKGEIAEYMSKEAVVCHVGPSSDDVIAAEDEVVVCNLNSISETSGLDEFTIKNKADREIYLTVQTADSGDFRGGAELEDPVCDAIPTAAITMEFEVIAWDVDPITEVAESNESTGDNSDKPEQDSDLPEDLEIGNVSVTTDEQKHNLDAEKLAAPLEVQEQTMPSDMGNVPDSIVATTTPTKFTAAENRTTFSSVKKSAVVCNKENAGFAMYDNRAASTEKKKAVQSDWKQMSMRQLRKELERMSISDKRHDESERKRPALATLPENCLKSPQPGARC